MRINHCSWLSPRWRNCDKVLKNTHIRSLRSALRHSDDCKCNLSVVYRNTHCQHLRLLSATWMLRVAEAQISRCLCWWIIHIQTSNCSKNLDRNRSSFESSEKWRQHFLSVLDYSDIISRHTAALSHPELSLSSCPQIHYCRSPWHSWHKVGRSSLAQSRDQHLFLFIHKSLIKPAAVTWAAYLTENERAVKLCTGTRKSS